VTMPASNKPENWIKWAESRVDVLVQNSIDMNDPDFEVPSDLTVKHVREFLCDLATENDFAKLGRPRLWLSENGDFLFQWARKGAKLEFKFTSHEMIARVTTEHEVFCDKHPHSVHESQKFSDAVHKYQAA